MELWQFLAVSLGCSLVLIVIGFWFRKLWPQKPNWIIGYRTSMSMKNKETWVFAHAYCGKILILSGLIIIPVSIAAAILLELDSLVFETLLAWAVLILIVVPLIISIIPTEMALRKEFDRNGERRHI